MGNCPRPFLGEERVSEARKFRSCPDCHEQGDEWCDMPEEMMVLLRGRTGKPDLLGLFCPRCSFAIFFRRRREQHPDAMEVAGVVLAGGRIVGGEELIAAKAEIDREPGPGRTIDRIVIHLKKKEAVA